MGFASSAHPCLLNMQLEEQYHWKVRRSAGVLLGWCALVLITTGCTYRQQGKEIVIGGVAIIAGIAAVFLTRRIMKMPCPACGTNLYWSFREARQSDGGLRVCPQCGAGVQV